MRHVVRIEVAAASKVELALLLLEAIARLASIIPDDAGESWNPRELETEQRTARLQVSVAYDDG